MRGTAPKRRREHQLLLAALLLIVATPGGQAHAQGQNVGASVRPATMGTTADVVTLSPGDVVRITVWRKPELSGEFAIASDGSILHPLYRDLRVTGTPLAAVESQLRDFIARLETNPQFVIEALFRVSVEGEVRQPNVYNLRPETTIAQAIALAGGPTERGRRDRIRLVRGDGQVTRVDLRGTAAGQNGRLSVRSGDRIVVERAPDVFREVVTPTLSILGSIAAIVSVVLYSSNR